MDLAAALAYSRYATAALAAHPREREWLDASVDAPFAWQTESQAVEQAVASREPAAVASALRAMRRRAMLHTIARDLTRRIDLGEVVGGMTRLAEVALRAAVDVNHRELAGAHGEPTGVDGNALELVAIGMGKLGGGELNVSSDVDLVFAYPEEGETNGRRPLAHREFFDRLGRRVIGALGDITADGFVFRVDMRLRPYGDSGPLTVPYSALEQYLITQGRAWERYAWLKARALTGTRHAEIDALVEPFVYRKYLDYDAYEGLRDVHRQIREQGRRRDYASNVKLGEGGIREIEFVAQAIQIVRGGREPALRTRATLGALDAIASRRLLPETAVAELRHAYRFLRDVEHRLQYRDDAQTQALPAEPSERAALADAMGFADASAFERELARHREAAATHFNAVLGAPESASAQPVDGAEAVRERFAAIWRGEVSPDLAQSILASAGFADPKALAQTLERFRASRRYAQLPALSQQRVDSLVPQLLVIAANENAPGADTQTVFVRLLSLIETVATRSAYLALVIEHPPLLPRLAHLIAASAWAAGYLGRHPILLDELLDARVLLAEPDWSAWRRELAQMMADHAGDSERQMDALRHFQHAHLFRLLSQDIAGLLSVERLADHLSALADTVLDATLAAVWAQMHGADAAPPRFAIVGYGKLGGKELGYASDLDLVFLYEDEDGDAAQRYARLAQRVITWLTSTTAAGLLYDVDLRLRPDGASGLLVTSLAAFRKYQHESAWTWEHQAITRARFVAGDAGVGAAFEAERERILRVERDPVALAADVVEMRRKMHAGHPNPSELFDLKHDPGGMVDVEFAVQQLVLAHSHSHARLTGNLGNIALLGIAADLGLVARDIATDAANAYRDYRKLQHQIRLTDARHARVDAAAHAAHRATVSALWTAIFGEPWEKR
jgi:glutamate-ammonia-ligase adenylyltransferase